MAKSLRSKRARKMRAIKRVRYGAKELVRLQDMLKKAETSEGGEDVNSGFRLIPPPSSSSVSGNVVSDEVAEKMEVSDKKRIDPKTMRDEDGNYPEWFNQKRIKRLRRARQRKAKNQNKKRKQR